MTQQSQPATGRQLHTISLLCMACHITDYLEDNHMSMAEAGKLIRQLIDRKNDMRKHTTTPVNISNSV